MKIVITVPQLNSKDLQINYAKNAVENKLLNLYNNRVPLGEVSQDEISCVHALGLKTGIKKHKTGCRYRLVNLGDTVTYKGKHRGRKHTYSRWSLETSVQIKTKISWIWDSWVLHGYTGKNAGNSVESHLLGAGWIISGNFATYSDAKTGKIKKIIINETETRSLVPSLKGVHNEN